RATPARGAVVAVRGRRGHRDLVAAEVEADPEYPAAPSGRSTVRIGRVGAEPRRSDVRGVWRGAVAVEGHTENAASAAPAATGGARAVVVRVRPRDREGLAVVVDAASADHPAARAGRAAIGPYRVAVRRCGRNGNVSSVVVDASPEHAAAATTTTAGSADGVPAHADALERDVGSGRVDETAEGAATRPGCASI